MNQRPKKISHHKEVFLGLFTLKNLFENE